jgi:uncharacterized membrane protein
MKEPTTPDHVIAETFADRLSDRIAALGGSWTFIGISIALLIAWTVVNTFVLGMHGRAFDPYPYVFLNLLLSMLAALQAPIIMMSQNRQAERDRRAAAEDFLVNSHAANQLDSLREQLAALRETQWKELVSLQREQMRLLERLAEAQPAATSSAAATTGS